MRHLFKFALSRNLPVGLPSRPRGLPSFFIEPSVLTDLSILIERSWLYRLDRKKTGWLHGVVPALRRKK